MAVPRPDEITETQRAVLGCPDYTDKMAETWKESPIFINEDVLQIQGHPVMERWLSLGRRPKSLIFCCV